MALSLRAALVAVPLALVLAGCARRPAGSDAAALVAATDDDGTIVPAWEGMDKGFSGCEGG